MASNFVTLFCKSKRFNDSTFSHKCLFFAKSFVFLAGKESLFVAERDTSRQINPEDVAVAEAISGKIIALGRRGGNPVCRIKQRARVSRAR